MPVKLPEGCTVNHVPPPVALALTVYCSVEIGAVTVRDPAGLGPPTVVLKENDVGLRVSGAVPDATTTEMGTDTAEDPDCKTILPLYAPGLKSAGVMVT